MTGEVPGPFAAAITVATAAAYEVDSPGDVWRQCLADGADPYRVAYAACRLLGQVERDAPGTLSRLAGRLVVQ